MLLEDSHGNNNYTFAGNSGSENNPAAELDTRSARLKSAGSLLQLDEVGLRETEVVYGSVDARGAVTSAVDASGFNVDLRHLALQPMRVREWQVDAKLTGISFALAGWNAPITFRSGTAKLRNGTLQSDFSVDFGKSARVNGTFTAPDVEHAIIKFDLKTDDIDLDELMAEMTNTSASKPRQPAAAKTESTARVQPSPAAGAAGGVGSPAGGCCGVVNNSELVAEGHLAAERIRSGPHVAGPASADLRLFTDRMEIWPLTVRIYDGSVQASARTDRKQTPQRFSVNVQARNLNMGEMIVTSPAMRQKFAGTGELDLQLIGSLGETLQTSLTGKGQFAVRNGRITGFSLSGVAGSVGVGGTSGDTMFTAITGDLGIAAQRITSRNIHLESLLGSADLRGSCGFDGSLNYDGQISAPAATGPNSSAAGAGSVSSAAANRGHNGNVIRPFALHGTLEAPQFVPGKAGRSSLRRRNKSAMPSPANQPQRGFSFPNSLQK
jgi:hypothetical protein